MKHRFVNLECKYEPARAIIYSPNETINLCGGQGEITRFIKTLNLKLYFGLLFLGPFTNFISSDNLKIKHRQSGRYFSIYKLIYRRWCLIKTVRRLPKKWMPELNIDESYIPVAEDALREKGLDDWIGLLPRDPKKVIKKNFKLGRLKLEKGFNALSRLIDSSLETPIENKVTLDEKLDPPKPLNITWENAPEGYENPQQIDDHISDQI